MKKEKIYNIVIIVLLISLTISISGRTKNKLYLNELNEQIQQLEKERMFLIDSIASVTNLIQSRQSIIDSLAIKINERDDTILELKRKEVRVVRQLEARIREIELLTSEELQAQIISRYGN